MTPEQLAELWQNELSKDVRYKTWQQFTCDEVDARVRVATTILEKLAYDVQIEQPNALAKMICDLDRRIARVEGEIFQTIVGDRPLTKHRQTLLGRVNELSSMAALGAVDQSFFLE